MPFSEPSPEFAQCLVLSFTFRVVTERRRDVVDLLEHLLAIDSD